MSGESERLRCGRHPGWGRRFVEHHVPHGTMQIRVSGVFFPAKQRSE
jgi:hypothetical protein